MKNKANGRGAHYIVLAICGLVVLVCAVILVKTFIAYSEANSVYEDMTITSEETGNEPDENEAVPQRILSLMESYRKLKTEHSNVVGYINIPSVSISYPVVQWSDNEYYTKHLITGEENKSGSIFLDFRISASPQKAPNLILYGHNMNDKSMFHNMRDLFDEEIFRETVVEYICDEGVFLYDSLAVYVTDTSDPYYKYNFYDEDSFSAFFEERAEKSRVSVEYGQISNMITLVTCSNSATKPDQRYLYHGMLVKAYTDLGENNE